MTDSSDPALSLPAEPAPRPPPSGRGYLDGLNPEQRQAVESLDGPLLVLAGAGTGKTRVLTTRLAHILATGRARPGQVLAVTFTNKAAREMIGRVERLIGRPTAGLWFGTFHAIAARILRYHAELAGLKPDFTILDTDDQERLLKQLIRADNIDEKRWPARTLSVIVQRWKDRGLTADKVAGADGADYANGRAPSPLQAAYQERLRTVNAADFGDLLLHNLTLFTKPSGRARRLISGASGTCWWTSIRTPTSRNISGSGCWRRRITASAASATTTSRSTAGAAPRSATSSASSRISPARRWCGWSATTAPPGTSSPRPPASSPATKGGSARRSGPRASWARRSASPRPGTARRRRAPSARKSRRCNAPARASIPSPSWCAPASRPVPSRSASSPSPCPTA